MEEINPEIEDEEVYKPGLLPRDEMRKLSRWSCTQRWSDAETVLSGISELSRKEKVHKMVKIRLF